MRFAKESDCIPIELITDVYEGRALFLCGAGVSNQTNFPLFKELTELVYDGLGENKEDEQVENETFQSCEFDRTLGLLENRIQIPGQKSRIRKLVTEILSSNGTEDLSYHKDLLNLSRDSRGRIRLATTNFDCQFELAAMSMSICWESHALSMMPKPGSGDDFGIFHLHGRIANKKLNLKASDLILTSSDFGDAYLRETWVSRYIEDRMRVGPLVLVGYGANDTAMRMLLEAINNDRARLDGYKLIYALDKKAPNASDWWASKGISLIGFDEYDDIYKTLKLWATYNVNPDEFIENEFKRILL